VDVIEGYPPVSYNTQGKHSIPLGPCQNKETIQASGIHSCGGTGASHHGSEDHHNSWIKNTEYDRKRRKRKTEEIYQKRKSICQKLNTRLYRFYDYVRRKIDEALSDSYGSLFDVSLYQKNGKAGT